MQMQAESLVQLRECSSKDARSMPKLAIFSLDQNTVPPFIQSLRPCKLGQEAPPRALKLRCNATDAAPGVPELVQQGPQLRVVQPQRPRAGARGQEVAGQRQAGHIGRGAWGRDGEGVHLEAGGIGLRLDGVQRHAACRQITKMCLSLKMK